MSLAQIAAKYGIREAYVRGALLVLAIDGTFVPNDPTSI
jgi:DNA-binding transcriptional regulator PaaX